MVLLYGPAGRRFLRGEVPLQWPSIWKRGGPPPAQNQPHSQPAGRSVVHLGRSTFHSKSARGNWSSRARPCRTESGQLRAVHLSRHKWPGKLVNLVRRGGVGAAQRHVKRRQLLMQRQEPHLGVGGWGSGFGVQGSGFGAQGWGLGVGGWGYGVLGAGV